MKVTVNNETPDEVISASKLGVGEVAILVESPHSGSSKTGDVVVKGLNQLVFPSHRLYADEHHLSSYKVRRLRKEEVVTIRAK